ncbi:hypothetical protein Tco_0911119 [Tanacetum coccineum]|uniref:Uncharacterized protein n=1 Tax=Tanacetum coccineum TaxID=301880 RepID=A0ABQ5CVQ8_9ASTR
MAAATAAVVMVFGGGGAAAMGAAVVRRWWPRWVDGSDDVDGGVWMKVVCRLWWRSGVRLWVESSRDEEDLGEDASKQGRINAIDADEDITLVNDQEAAKIKELMEI